jgi:hypothetical protein
MYDAASLRNEVASSIPNKERLEIIDEIYKRDNPK